MTDGQDPAARQTRLEEAALFTERRLDELHEQVVALSKQFHTLDARLTTLERVLARTLAEPPAPEEDAPPPP